MTYRLLPILLALALTACTPNNDSPIQENQDSEQKEPPKASTFSGKVSTIYTTASETDLRLTQTDQQTFASAAQPLENEISVFVNPQKSFQTFLGIGGAITDASAEVFAQLPPEKQEEFLKAYFDREEGIGYSLCRTPIHSCDFSSASYTYIEEGDKELKTFSIDHDSPDQKSYGSSEG